MIAVVKLFKILLNDSTDFYVFFEYVHLSVYHNLFACLFWDSPVILSSNEDERLLAISDTAQGMNENRGKLLWKFISKGLLSMAFWDAFNDKIMLINTI